MPPKKIHLLFIFALLIGPIAALTSHFFLLSLEKVIAWHKSFPHLSWALPFIGLFMAFVLKRASQKLSWGTTHFLEQLRHPHQKSTPLLSLWIYLASCLSHLGGGSVGREGVGLLINGSVMDMISPFKKDSKERSMLLQAALSAGFTGMFGTPLAGIFFVFEVNQFFAAGSALRWVLVSISVVTTYLVSQILNTPHMQYSSFQGVGSASIALFFLFLPLANYSFYYFYKLFHSLFKRLGFYQLPLGGFLLSIIIFMIGDRYCGLGTDIIREAIVEGKVLPWDWIFKIILTTLTIGIGFRGGEVTPLFFVGSTLGAAIGQYTGDVELAKIAFACILGSLTHTPLTAGILSYELFGPLAFMWAMVFTFWGQISLRGRHIYRLS